MISFKNFVESIHNAIMAANESLMDKNTGLLDQFFESHIDEDELQSALNDALKASKDLSGKKADATGDDLNNANEAFEKVNKILSPTDKDSIQAKLQTLTPKSVVVQYPHQTPTGIEFVDVHVPLITLVPLGMTQIEKATFTANFEMEIKDNEVHINFTDRSRGSIGRRSKTTRGKLELTISPQETSEGLKQLIEGYENALKAQIPQ